MNEHLINMGDRVNENITLINNFRRDSELPYLEGYERPYSNSNREECVICSDNDSFTYRSWVKLGCQHYFHRHCIDIWISQRPTCPLCNRDVFNSHSNRTDRNDKSLFWAFWWIFIIGIIISVIITNSTSK